jgi:hypothetical protein
MRVVPTEQAAKIAWFRARLAAWNANLALLGLTAPEMAAPLAQVDAAEDALAARTDAENVAKAKTAILNAALETLAANGGRLVNKIRANAELAADPVAVFAAAQIPAPATPSPVGAPGTPTDFKAVLMQGGDVDLAWKAAQPARASGTTYQVYRRFTPTAAWDFLGASGERKFIDSTIPAGVTFVMYKIRGIRSTMAGPWGEFNVTFGAGAGDGGALVASVSSATASAPKIAA